MSLKKSCKNVRWKTSTTTFEINGLKNTTKSIIEIQTGRYKISEYREFEIFEPKRRSIKATRIKDRQIQRSLCDSSIYNDITKSFIYDNAACQIGKGTDFALNRLNTHLRKFYNLNKTNNGWYLKCDIHHFFESINHDILKIFVSKQIKDKLELEMCLKIIDSFGEKGLGLGSQLSQLFALLYLNELDHLIKENLHIKFYIRYMDDFILVHDNKYELKKSLQFIKNYLNSIGLELNKKTTIGKINNGIIFLNWKFILTDKGKIIRQQTRQRTNNRLRKLKRLKHRYDIGLLTKNQFISILDGYIAHLQKGNCHKMIYNINKIKNSL